jgi:hypothetical protein
VKVRIKKNKCNNLHKENKKQKPANKKKLDKKRAKN